MRKPKPQTNSRPCNVAFRMNDDELAKVRRAVAKRFEKFAQNPRTMPRPSLANFIVQAAVERAEQELRA
jgi:hypothetical protein